MAINTEQQYITIGYLRCLIDYLRSLNIPIALALEGIGLTEAELSDLDRRIPDTAEDALLLTAARLTQDANIGLHAGQSMRPTHLGILGHLLMTCQSSREWFELHMRYERLVGNGTAAEYSVVGNLICLTLHRRGSLPPYTRHVMEYSLAGWISLARWLAGPDFSPERIEFPHAEPEDTHEQSAFFQCELAFGCQEFRVFFSPRTLALPLLHGDTTLRATLETEASRRLRALQVEQIDTDPQIARLRQFIADSLALGLPEIGEAAQHMELSVRSLQRKLTSSRTTYSEVVEQVRQNMAESYAKDVSLSLAEVALMLGFSEQSAFQRAFRRWFNVTPGEFRRRQTS